MDIAGMHRLIFRGRVAALLAGLAACVAWAIPAAAQMAIVSVDPVMLARNGAPTLLVRATFPAKRGAPLPLVILSHGNLLSRTDYGLLVGAWARAGFLVLQPDHVDASHDGLAPTTPQPTDTWRRRIVDVAYLLDRLDAIERMIHRKIDRRRIAVAGHSLGGLTAEALVGARILDPSTGQPASFADPRVKAALLLAPPGSAAGLVPAWQRRAPYLAVDFAALRGPLLLIAGAADNGSMSTRGWRWRTEPFDGMRSDSGSGKACLLVVAGAGHYLGGINGPFQPPVDIDADRLALVREATITFLHEALDASATPWTRYRAKLHPGTGAVADITCK